MDDRTRPTGADDTGELSRQHRGRRKAKPHRRRALHVAVLVPLAIASASWAAVSFNTPIREATHSWFPDGYNVAVAPAKTTPTTEPETTTEEDSEPTAGKQNTENTTPETTEGRNRVPVTAQPTDDSDDNGGSRSDDADDSSPNQPDPKQSKKAPVPNNPGPTAPPSNDPEPQPTVTERPTSQPTEDPGPSDDGGGDDGDDGGIIDIDIDLPLPLPLVAAPGPEASKTGTNSLVETGIPGAVPGTGKHTSVTVNVADLATWTFIVWQSIS